METIKNRMARVETTLLIMPIARDLAAKFLILTISIIYGRLVSLKSLKIPLIRTPLYQKQNKQTIGGTMVSQESHRSSESKIITEKVYIEKFGMLSNKL